MLLLSAKKQALNFNPRSHERSDSTSSASYSFWINFNPRSHERSDPLSQTILLLYRLFQSTLPREERPYLFAVNALLSNHFNPRSHERSDVLYHAHQYSTGESLPVFQSTLPREERLVVKAASATLTADFNPRSHERSDCCGSCSVECFDYFNPRSHERSDTSALMTSDIMEISIHAPTRGATANRSNDRHGITISIHAPTRGATQAVC